MLLVGSRALAHYLDVGRTFHDWDVWMTEVEYAAFVLTNKTWTHIKSTPYSHLYEKRGHLLEIKSEAQFEPTDKIIFNKTDHIKGSSIIGECFVPSIQTIWEMKKATATYIDEPKHKHDLNLIESKYPEVLKSDDMLVSYRMNETRIRVEKSKQVKFDFFHKYHIPEYIYHDNLHVIIGDLMELNLSTYLRITSADTDIAEDLFNKLTHDQKVSLMVEESLVLALERWFIPQMVENGINHHLVDIFYNNNEGLPTYKILKHCCITGLKGEAEYITGFARANFFEIEKRWIEVKQQIKDKNGFPPSFYNQLFDLRKRYKAGEKVGLHEKI